MGVILALQAAEAIHLGVDNLNEVRHVGRLVDGDRGSTPVELLDDGDLILLIDRILEQSERGTVRISKVKGHAEEDMVQDGRVRELVGLAIMQQMRQLILDALGWIMLSYMLGVIWPASVGVGIQ